MKLALIIYILLFTCQPAPQEPLGSLVIPFSTPAHIEVYNDFLEAAKHITQEVEVYKYDCQTGKLEKVEINFKAEIKETNP